MFATLNLQLAPAVALDELPGATMPLPLASADGGPNFTDLLQIRVDSGLSNGQPGGEFLPEGGSELPLPAPVPVAVPGELAVPAMIGSRADAKPVAASAADASVVEPEPRVFFPADVIPPEGVEAVPAPTWPVGEVHRNLREQDTPQPVLQPNIDAATDAKDTRPLPLPVVAVSVQQTQELAARPALEAGVLPAALASRRTRLALPAMSNTVAPGANSGEIPDGLQPPRPVEAAPPLRAEAVVEATQVKERPLITQTQAIQHAQHSVALPGAAPANGESPYVAVSGQTTATINTPVQDPGWGDRMSERVLLLTSGQAKTAEIRLTPAELGPVRVNVSIDDGAANVTFHAQHAVTREALEQALPRLRELLAENGLSLGQASVAGQDVADGNRERNTDAAASRVIDDGLESELPDAETSTRQNVVTANGLVDTFA